MDKLREESFLGRWSRLKRSNDSEALAEATAISVRQGVHEDVSVPEIAPEPQPILTDADMPDLEHLDDSSEFSGFLSEGVSEALRRKAMKKLFHLPEFNIRDALNEYDEDFSTFIPMGDTVTYQMKQLLEQQTQDFKQAMADDESEVIVEIVEPDVAESLPIEDVDVVAVDTNDELDESQQVVVNSAHSGG
jgi:Protein of unknown function (DUF3306)